MYTINEKTGLDKDYYGYETIYEISFQFEKQSCLVSVAIADDRIAYIKSESDGYHWLHYFLSQEVNCKLLCDLSHDEETKKVVELFSPLNIIYVREDKETAYLYFNEIINDESINKIASLIEPLLANRERFFD